MENKNYNSNENLNSSHEYDINHHFILEESEKIELESCNRAQYVIFARNFRKKTIENFLYPKNFNNLKNSDNIEEIEYKNLFFNDFEKENFFKKKNQQIMSEIDVNYSENNINIKKDKKEKIIINDYDKDNLILSFLEDSINDINKELFQNQQIYLKYIKNLDLLSKLDKLNINQADFLNLNNVEEIMVPKKKLTYFHFKSENYQENLLIRKPLDSLIPAKIKLESKNNTSINENIGYEKLEKEKNYFYNYTFNQNGKLEYPSLKNLEKENNVENINNDLNNNSYKISKSSLSNIDRSSLKRKSKMNKRNSIKFQNISQNFYYEKKYLERKNYNEKGIMSFNSKYNFKKNHLEKFFKEDLINEDNLDFIKFIDYRNNNKIEFFDIIDFVKKEFSYYNNDKNICNNFSMGKFYLNSAINLKTLQKRANMLVDSRIQPVYNTIKKIFELISHIKHKVEIIRSNKTSTGIVFENKRNSKKSLINNITLNIKLSNIRKGIEIEDSKLIFSDNEIKNYNYEKDYCLNNNNQTNFQTPYLKDDNSISNENGFIDKNEKENISFGKDKIYNINKQNNYDLKNEDNHLKITHDDYDDNYNKKEEENITSLEKAKEYKNKLKLILGKSKKINNQKLDNDKTNKTLKNKNIQGKDNNTFIENPKNNSIEKIISIPKEINIGALKNFIHDKINRKNGVYE